MKRDVFLRSVYAGVLSAIIYALAELVAIQMGYLRGSVWEAAAGMYLPIDQVATPLGILIGLIGHLAVGGLWGISFYLFLLFVGFNRSVYKGFISGFYIWLFSTLMMRWGATSYMLFDVYQQIGALFGSLIFGLSMGFLVPRMTMEQASKSNTIYRGFLVSKIVQPAYKPMHDETEDSRNKNET